ncbi:MAG: virulence RhuM family protein [Sulfuricaulis sp.]|uniref:virulence protein RhuM/Fic/DOC family protein n=1 Tax=Sulfuricaulis sp. TaxID=2003553 RepID=UPI0025CE80B5|nr:virulence protein RhuM/Fic/DOC family protein [Sulfuricaulis sp.]MCR4345977.1 virulence RhuM family protein [Sulfuricaulis sp.]
MNNRQNNLGEVVLYKTEDGKAALDVTLDGDTVWLSQKQMGELFDKNVRTVSEHLRNIFKDGELKKSSVIRNFRITAADGKTYDTQLYNLDVIISVGYRVKSKRGTQFRIWATQTLKDHLVRGYTLNERRLSERGIEMEQAVQLLSRTLTRHELVTEDGRGVLDVIARYAKSWLLLKEYDDNTLSVPERRRPARVAIDYARARENINMLKARLMEKGEASNLFGQERTEQLIGILGAIEQTFGGDPLYPSIEEKAAHLLYFVIKDHPFTDGNKRIGSFLFILFLRANDYLEDVNGVPKINDNALVALALLTAESEPRNKELMIRLIMNLLADK